MPPAASPGVHFPYPRDIFDGGEQQYAYGEDDEFYRVVFQPGNEGKAEKSNTVA